MDTIAILLATYNGDKYLEAQLKSICQQTYKNIKCYIHDDGSKDNTIKLLQKYSKNYVELFKIIEAPSTGGARANFMFLLRQVNEKYIMFCDQDDIWLPEKVEIMYKRIKEIEAGTDNNKPIVGFSDLVVVDQNLIEISDSFMSMTKRNTVELTINRLLARNAAPGCTMIINNSLANRALNYLKEENLEMHDWWFMLIAATFGEIFYVNKGLMLYRQHINNEVGAHKRYSLVKVKKLFNLSLVSSTKKNILSGIRFAEELLLFKDLDYINRTMLEELVESNKMGKFNKIKTHMKYKMYPDIITAIWIIICI